MDKISEYKRVIENIRKYAEGPESTSEERKLMFDLLGTIRYSLEFQLLRDCYLKDEIYNSIIPDIESKINVLEEDIKPVKEKIEQHEDVGIMSEIKNEATDMAIDRCKKVEEMIEKHEFANYVAFMNKEIKSSNQIIGVCTNVLSDANISLIKNFNVDGRDYTIVDLIYIMQTNPVLIDELKAYFGIEEETNNFNKEEIEDLEKLINYLKTAKVYERELREFMLLLFKVRAVSLNGGQTNKEIALREDLKKNKARLEEITDENVLTQLLYIRDKNSCLDHIRKDEEEIEVIEKNKLRLKTLRSRLMDTELAPVIEIMTDYDFTMSTPEYKAREYLRATMNKTNFFIADFIRKLNTQLAHLKEQRNKQKIMLSSSKLSPIARDLIEIYHDDAKKLLAFVERDKTTDISPVFSAYVLKALHLAKNISIENIEEAMTTIPSENYDIILKEVTKIVNSTVNDVEDAMYEVQNRTPYDTKEYSDLKIR